MSMNACLGGVHYKYNDTPILNRKLQLTSLICLRKISHNIVVRIQFVTFSSNEGDLASPTLPWLVTGLLCAFPISVQSFLIF